MAKFIQICASQNDLFALDQDGGIHRYNFNTNAWEELAPDRAAERPPRSDRRPGSSATWGKP